MGEGIEEGIGEDMGESRGESMKKKKSGGQGKHGEGRGSMGMAGETV